MADRLSVKDSWSGKDREAFWAEVRLRMATQQLDQSAVAEALMLDRGNVSRRLTGKVAERPSRTQVERLTEVLGMDAPSRAELFRLAGYATDPPAVSSVDGQPTIAISSALEPSNAKTPVATNGPHPGPARRVRTLVALAATAMVILAAVVAVLVLRPSSVAQEASGQIISPGDGSMHALGWIELRGTTRLPTPDAEHLWVVEELAGYFWPQQQAVVDGVNWSAQARLGAGPDDVGKQLTLLLVLTPEPADHELRAWLEQGGATGDYRPMRGLPAGTRVLDQIMVTITMN